MALGFRRCAHFQAGAQVSIRPTLALSILAISTCGCTMLASWPWQPAPVIAQPTPQPDLPPILVCGAGCMPITDTDGSSRCLCPPTTLPTPPPAPVDPPTPPPGPVVTPPGPTGPGAAVYPRKVDQVRIKVHIPSSERFDRRAIMDGVALACGDNLDFQGRRCWPASGPEGTPNRDVYDRLMPAYWIGGQPHSNPWLRFAAPGESVRACVGASATTSGLDVCSEPVEGR